jgi:hypothetical protein
MGRFQILLKGEPEHYVANTFPQALRPYFLYPNHQGEWVLEFYAQKLEILTNKSIKEIKPMMMRILAQIYPLQFHDRFGFNKIYQIQSDQEVWYWIGDTEYLAEEGMIYAPFYSAKWMSPWFTSTELPIRLPVRVEEDTLLEWVKKILTEEEYAFIWSWWLWLPNPRKKPYP